MGAVTGFEHLSLVKSQTAPGESRAFTIAELEDAYLSEIRALRRRARLRLVGTATRNRPVSVVESPRAC